MPLLIKTTGFEEFLDPSGGAYIKALIMGDHGVGKTPSAAHWPKPIFADCEKGLMSVADLAVPYADIRHSADMDALLDQMRIDAMKPAASRRFQTLVIDTIDSYQRKLIAERLKSERKESLSGWADWGWLDGKMSLLLERLLNLPMNVVVNMHIKDVTVEDGDDSRLVQKARLKGDIKDSIFQDFDLIGRMEQSYVAGTGDKKGERVRVRQIRWHSEPMYPSLRDRSNKLPRFTDVDFTPDDFQRIFDAITSGVDDLPESTQLDSLPVEGEVEAPTADATGGPVAEPKLPQPKPAAKKAPAKKAPAKKAPAKKAEPTPEPEPEAAKAADDWTPPPAGTDDPWAPDAGGAHREAVDLLQQELGAEVIEETPVAEETVADLTPPTVEPAVEPVPEVESTPVPDPAPAARAAKHCGDQPASMVGKFDPLPGCGVELTAENAKRHQIAVIKFRTYLCDNDLTAQQQLAAG